MASTYFIHSSLRQMRHWSTTSTDRFWLVRAASILFRMVGPTGNREGHSRWGSGSQHRKGGTLPLPLLFWCRQPPQKHPPRSAATGLPLVTTNSYLLRDWSSSHPTRGRLEGTAVWTSTMTANSVAIQTHCSSECPPLSSKPISACCSNHLIIQGKPISGD